MICAIDIETRGLNAQEFVIGCLKVEGKKKSEFFYKSEDLWDRVVSLGISCAKRDKVLYVYSHNAKFDTAGYVNLKDKNLEFLSFQPFIWSYNLDKKTCDSMDIRCSKENRQIIKFLDSCSIYRMSLEELGELIGIKKLETPKELIEGNEILKGDIKKYVEKDTEIVLKSILFMKDKLKNEGIKIRRLYTINQIAINYILYSLRKKGKDYIFENFKGYKVKECVDSDFVHKGYRGGRVESFKRGNFNGCSYVDYNSLYPSILKEMDFINLDSGYTKEKCDINDLDYIGVIRVLIENKNNELGLIPVRTGSGSYYIKKGQCAIGTYSTVELKKAIKEGYRIVGFGKGVLFERGENPFKDIIEPIYEKRNNSKFDNYFYKMVLNASIGKFGQHRCNQKILLDSVEKVDNYLEKSFNVIGGNGENYYYRNKGDGKKKDYYCPIIGCLVTANARIKMYDLFKKVDKEDLLYTDTDSMIYKDKDYRIECKEGLGNLKLVEKNQECMIYGRKSYCIGGDIKLSGVSKKFLNIKDFKEGKVNYKRMIGLNSRVQIDKVGQFESHERLLLEEMERGLRNEKKLRSEFLLIDDDIENINEFLHLLKEI